MKLSKAGATFIHSFEGLRLEAYKAVPTEKYWTIGFGHYGSDVKQGQKISKAEADALFINDIARYEKGVEDAITKPMNQNEFDAMVSLCYNIGVGAFSKSTLAELFNKGDKEGASEQFDRWNKSGGRVLKGLVTRRSKEKALFLKPVKKKSTPKTYTVKRGDSLSKIAKANKLTLKQLLALNPKIRNANIIFVGQKINLKK